MRIWSLAALACVSIFLPGFAAQASDFYLTPEGSGSRDGTTWSDALDQGALQQVVNERMGPGDRLLLGGGTYDRATLVITKSGAPGRPLAIIGVDRGEGLPVFSGPWSSDRPSEGLTAIRLEAGVSNVRLSGLRIRGYVFGIHAPAAGDGDQRSHLAIDDVDIERFRYGIYLVDCDDVELADCDLNRYTKHAFRFDAGCDRVSVKRCVADCSLGDTSWETRTELLPFGFLVGDSGEPSTAFRFEDCLASNNLMPLQQSRYKNGDGFVVEANASDVQFLRCRALRNQDAGFDLKVRDVQLVDCVAIGNSRNFRIWSTGSLINCFAGWGQSALWNNGGPVQATRCSFHHLADAAVQTDDSATRATTLDHCLISGTARAVRNTAAGQVILEATVVADPRNAQSDPRYPRAEPSWNGLGQDLDSRAYPDHGYRAPAHRQEGEPRLNPPAA